MIRVDSRAVRRRRENLGMSQLEFAALVHISPSYASMIERGERTVLSPGVAVRLARVLDIDIELLRQPGPRLRRPRVTAPTEVGAVVPGGLGTGN